MTPTPLGRALLFPESSYKTAVVQGGGIELGEGVKEGGRTWGLLESCLSCSNKKGCFVGEKMVSVVGEEGQLGGGARDRGALGLWE